MVRRLGVGATSAAALIFSVILLSNFAMYAASQDRAVLYSKADAEDLLSAEGTALAGVAATNILLGAQSVLESGPMDCTTARSYVSAQLATLADAQHAGPLAVSASSMEVPGGDASDNLSMVFPFNGSSVGYLSLALRVSAKTDEPLGGVSLDRSVTHVVHLPLRWDSLLEDCNHAVAAIYRAVSTSTVSNCTSKFVDPAMAEASAGPDSIVKADGFAFEFSHSILVQEPCTVSFRVALEQDSVSGPGGEFNVLLEESGVASFA